MKDARDILARDVTVCKELVFRIEPPFPSAAAKDIFRLLTCGAAKLSYEFPGRHATGVILMTLESHALMRSIANDFDDTAVSSFDIRSLI